MLRACCPPPNLFSVCPSRMGPHTWRCWDGEQFVDKTATVTLNAGKNRVLVKMVSDDSSMWWHVKISARAFSMRLTDKDGKPVKWSHE